MRISVNSKIQSLDGRHRLYFFDTKNGKYGETPSFQIINELFGRNGRYIEKQVCYFGRYIFSKTMEELEEKKKKFFSDDYYYSVTDAIDNETEDLQKEIDRRVAEIREEIDEFFEKYGKAKYNRKDNKTKKEALRKLQKADLESGITKKEYMEKYNIKKTETFYAHVHRLCPNWTESEIKYNNMTDEMKEDILNGICCSKFIKKYNVSEASFYRYKHKIENELGVIMVSKIPGKNREMIIEGSSDVSYITDEQKEDIRNGITVSEYREKYKVSKDTFYNHRKLILKPEEIRKRHITLEDIISKEQRQDILSGMRYREYMKKYNCTEDTYYVHRRFIIPDDKERCKLRYDFNKEYQTGITEEQKRDLLNGISKKEYMLKYNVSHRTYEKYKKLVKIESEEH